MKTVALTKGFVAMVDDEDFERVSELKWHIGDQKKRKTPYAQATTNNPRATVMMHRLVMGLKPGDPEIDHKDRNGLNNQKSNLRFATKLQNQANRPSFGKKWGLKGVYRLRSGRWQAFLGKSRGAFDTQIEAIVAYNEAAKEKYGEFAYLNPLP